MNKDLLINILAIVFIALGITNVFVPSIITAISIILGVIVLAYSLLNKYLVGKLNKDIDASDNSSDE